MKVNVIIIEPKDIEKFGVTVTAGYAFCHRYHWRVRLALLLMKMAAFVANFGVREETEIQDEER